MLSCHNYNGQDAGQPDAMVESVCALFQKFGTACRADDSGMETIAQTHNADVRAALCACYGEAEAGATPAAVVDELMRLWVGIRERTLSLYSMAVQSYFQYLQVAEASAKDSDGRCSRMLGTRVVSTTETYLC